MRQRSTELSNNLIIFAIKRTHAFEEILCKSFCAETLTQLVISKTKDQEVDSTNPFHELLSKDTVDVSTINAEATDDESPLNGLISR